MNKYKLWIADRLATGADPFAKCSEWTQDMLTAFPGELARVRGTVTLSNGWEREHWWLVDNLDFTTYDPTVSQFRQPYYGNAVVLAYHPRDESEPEPTGLCHECGGYCYNNDQLCSKDCERRYLAYLNSIRTYGQTINADFFKNSALICRAKLALRAIIDQTGRYYNETRMVNICVAAQAGLVKR